MGDPVVAVLQPQPMPMHSRVQVTVVGDVDDELAALADLEGGAGDGAVVAQHPHPGLAEALGHRPDPQIEGVARGQHQQLGPARLRQPGGISRERLGCHRRVALSVVVHDPCPPVLLMNAPQVPMLSGRTCSRWGYERPDQPHGVILPTDVHAGQMHTPT
jgi:hypothetical protein